MLRALVPAAWALIVSLAGCSSGAAGIDVGPGLDLQPGSDSNVGSFDFQRDVQGGLDVPFVGPDLALGPDGAPLADAGADASPTEFACNPACGPGELCTSFKSCIPSLVLGADRTANLKLLSQAFVDCWNYAAANSNNNVLCYAIDSQLIVDVMKDVDYDAWVCGSATAADYKGGDADLATAKDLSGCGGALDPDNTCFKVAQIPRHTAGEYCIAFDNTLINEDLVDHCTTFMGEPVAAF